MGVLFVFGMHLWMDLRLMAGVSWLMAAKYDEADDSGSYDNQGYPGEN
jgi:hypothetical protein